MASCLNRSVSVDTLHNADDVSRSNGNIGGAHPGIPFVDLGFLVFVFLAPPVALSTAFGYRGAHACKVIGK